jgi:hypothetical protein
VGCLVKYGSLWEIEQAKLSKPFLTGKLTNDRLLLKKSSFQYSTIPSFRHKAEAKASKKLIHSICCRNSETLN